MPVCIQRTTAQSIYPPHSCRCITVNHRRRRRGFPEEEIENVFDKFYRLKNSKAGGTGLGLSIVKGFTEALNGNVNLEKCVNRRIKIYY